MIAILGAMPIEIETLMKQMVNVKQDIHYGQPFYTGMLAGQDTVLSCCGVGKVNAARVAQLCIAKYPVELLINTGVAGALIQELPTGSVVVSSSLVQHDVDTSALGDPIGYVSGCNIVYFKSEPNLLEKITNAAQKAASGKVLQGIIASGDAFIADQQKSSDIQSTFSAAAVDMESAAIAQVCFLCSIPFVAVRTISDGANEESPVDFPTLCAMAARNSEAILLEFIACIA